MIEVALILFGLLLIVATVILIVAGARRLSGRRSRFDPLMDAVARAQDAGVYPHSLRGDVSPQIDDGVRASQSANDIRHTPARSTRRRRSRRPPAVQ